MIIGLDKPGPMEKERLMMRIASYSVALGVTLLASACAEHPAAVVSPDLSVRAAKPVQPPQSGITVTALGTLPYSDGRRTADDGIALALNNGTSRSATRVGGWTRYGTNRRHPFTWTQETGISPLAVVEARPGWVQGVSDNGIMVGEINSSAGTQPFVVTATGPMSYLPVPAGSSGRATGISADGTCITGSVSDGTSGNAVIWRNGVLEMLGTGTAMGVTNDCLAVAGSSQGRAVTWRNVEGSWIVEVLPERGPNSSFVGPVVSTEATDMSPNGEYVSGRRADSASSSAVVWRRTVSGWVATDMPGPSSYAFGVDNSGRAVGNGLNDEPVLWTRGSTGAYSAQVLPSLTRNTRGWAAAINELGQVVGRSSNRYGVQPVIWNLPE
jgi:hypothetical protein